ncbi:uncharacterized protein LOC109135948 [Beta vulgaris subsp. vulgaris]|uniref:uncharacterized protein LOC109135948 n=1 Tax=Beta vulgaris subsp. vulgaris TaxID=3555 RepID=UPI0020366CEE|nr:uncharacterized protein LOC109135948 [Beta vulgaris subsp. vulgaris]
MEYLSRIVKLVGGMNQFQFHPRCKEVKLTHMCFADDLIMCYKGDFISMYLMLQSFKLFSQSSGLQANIQKSSLYCCGVSDSDVQRIAAIFGFPRHFPPFRFLGVPICSKRLTSSQCDALVDKMTCRIKIWRSRHLSYMARVQLINFVLMSLHMYWAQVFILPKKVLRDIVQVCRSFLWSGQSFSWNLRSVAWSKLCCGKNFGGLGFKDVFLWNIAHMGKYLWVVANKQENSWIKWVNSVYLKNASWWEYSPKANSSWYWKKVCHVKDILKQHYSLTDMCVMPSYSVKAVYNKLASDSVPVHWDFFSGRGWVRLNTNSSAGWPSRGV